MARSKLSEVDKQELVRLYRETSKNAPRLAEDFGISVSTATRILKSVIPEAEYLTLSQSKRNPKNDSASEDVQSSVEHAAIELPLLTALETAPEPEPETVAPVVPLTEETGDSAPRRRRRTQKSKTPVVAEAAPVVSEEEIPASPMVIAPEPVLEVPLMVSEQTAPSRAEEDSSIPSPIPAPPRPPLEILPYNQMELPEICYLVVDRWAELIARPLREFNFLENVPDQEQEAIALPVFDSHRWAKRYSNRFQRILKVPTHLLDITRTYLMNRGISRLLVGRQVFALTENGTIRRTPLTEGQLALDQALDEEELASLEELDEEKEFSDDIDETEDDYGGDNGF
ncbi:hypothetical protein [Anthocerotibacter panamensis]|uniref:hypothetical protein n=1 Tax=Anthocerotibacter panamensis TaxID=2857077 RepID=UPI001C40544F|nr:hypothetical protein [Anthocerotibacter panamensis]